MRCRRAGFTLIELAVVLLILAISVTVVFPKFDSALLGQVRLRNSAKRIASVVEYAGQRAAYAQLTHLLHIDTEQGTYWVTARKPDGQVVPITDGLSLKGRLPEGVRFANIELPGTKAFSRDVITIEFDPQGWADPATIYVACDAGKTIAIVIDELSGQVRTCELE
jgi:prepilin-type N-terminal cleavage/methylation domain-containing protein